MNGALMNVIRTEIPDLLILEPKVFGDARGFFIESYNARAFEQDTSVRTAFVQDNHSRSVRGVLRGLHYQIKQPQGKIVRVIGGEIWDVAVDLRRSSPTFKKWVGVRLSDENKRMLWIPKGFGHGFLVLSPSVDMLYKATDFYDPTSERSVRWNDPTLSISWPLKELGIEPILSGKDSNAPLFEKAELFD
jgi:dTDP-4-dehydrorhamnose 3,5-epimerase